MRLPTPAGLTDLPAPGPYEYEARLPKLPALSGDAKLDLADARQHLEALHRSGASGHTVVRLQSAAADRIVVMLWEKALAAAAPAPRARGHGKAKGAPARKATASPMALVALGGYGRRELAPYSDVDLLLLHGPGEPDAFIREASEKFLYSLWDLGLEVGYGVRDLAACDDLASQDHTARTALLDLRQLAGDGKLYRELEREQLHGLSQARLESFIADKVTEMRERRERFGDSLYLLEPNLKQSEGGLRDLQAALWIARARWKVAGITELLSRAILPEREIRELRRARDFLWRLRNELHYQARRKADQITFDVQPPVASALGYADGADGSGVEQLMRHYYLAAKTVLVACDAIVDRALESAATRWRHVPPPAAMTGAEKGRGPARGDWRLPGGEFQVFRGRLTVADKGVLRRSPAALARLFTTADREGLELYPYARDLATQAAAELPAEAASDPELSQELLSALMRPGTRGRFLSAMHEQGVLPRVMPEFARVTARRQIDVYHVYTVDVHSLFAGRRLLAMRCGDVQEETLTPLMQGLARPLGLYLGTLFHDIGKGLGDHSVVGAQIAAAACVRLGIDPSDAADVEWLVLKHLRMSSIAQRRDLSDPDLIHAFAEEVGTLDRLEKLYLLTYADIATVGPRTWTDWKARLLKELYQKTRAVLSTEVNVRPEPGTAEAAGRARTATAIAGRRPADQERFLAAMPARYFVTVDARKASRHLRLLKLGRGLPFAAGIRHRPALGYSELTITAADRPGLLALVAGVLAAHRIDIQHAEVFSSPDDGPRLGWASARALDLFEVRGPAGGALEPARWRLARLDLRRVLSGEESLESLVARKLRESSIAQKPLPRVAPKVVIDNDSSRDASVIDVFTADRMGLLHLLARTFFELGLTVDLARITTEGHRAADAFYVRTSDGRRLGPEEGERVKEALTEVLSARPG